MSWETLVARARIELATHDSQRPRALLDPHGSFFDHCVAVPAPVFGPQASEHGGWV